MRNTYERTTQRTKESLPWKWIFAISAIILVLLISRLFTNNSSSGWGIFLTVTPSEQWVAYISPEGENKTRIKLSDKLYPKNDILSVEVWETKAEGGSIFMDFDKNSEVTYKSHSESWETLSLSKWRVWGVGKTWENTLELKNASIVFSSEDIVLAEQNTLYSNIYVIAGNPTISTKIWNIEVPAGNRIMIAASDLIGDKSRLSDLMWAIDESIMQNPVFVRNNGEVLLQKLKDTGTGMTMSGTWISFSWSGIEQKISHAVSIQDPQDGSMITKGSIVVSWNISWDQIKRITLNDLDAVISPVNKTFTLKDFPITADTTNIVYKAYDDRGNMVDRWVISVFASKEALSGNNKLIPNNFPLTSKDFKIVFPTENPYKTTDLQVKVQWSVTKNMVKYIVVNDFKLQKFVPNSTTWYYYANTQNDTMKDGINLYNIKFYGADNTLLYTQLFTIVKESKNAISSEAQ